jgi:cytochrome P450
MNIPEVRRYVSLRSVKSFLLRLLLRRRPWLWLRRHLPTWWWPLTNFLLFARHDDTVDVLRRDRDFGVPYLAKMEALGAIFVLGLDRSKDNERQHAALHSALSAIDLPGVDRQARAETWDKLRACEGRIDIVTGVTEPVLMRSIEAYLGTGPSDEQQLRDARDVFWDIFINPFNDPWVHEVAKVAAERLLNQVGAVVADRRAQWGRGGQPGHDVLGRLLQMDTLGNGPQLTNKELVASLVGLLVAWVTSVSRTMAFTFDELLGQPKALASAKACACAGDGAGVTEALVEAMRLEPSVPAIERVCLRDCRVGGKVIKRDTRVMVALTSAMLDPKGVPHAPDFLTGRRQDAYLQYGHGLHSCLGRQISLVQMTAIATVMLSRPNVRRGSRLKLPFTYPYPRRLDLKFDV